jgi:hypothetical protein
LNTVPIFQVCQRMHLDPGLDVHARLAFFVWQMRRTSRAVPWIYNKSTDRDLHIHLVSTAPCLVSCHIVCV